MDSSNHARILKLISEMTKSKMITDKEKDTLKGLIKNEYQWGALYEKEEEKNIEAYFL
jgi:hypothetical protein